jgi:Fe2+ or Zn2+ uptake regulation protein
MAREVIPGCGLLMTHRREAVLKVLEHADAPLTAEEIHGEAALSDKMGLSTTYRVLSQLTAHGVLIRGDGVDGRFYYQLNRPAAHKHTLHCAVCNCVVPIDGCPLGPLVERLSEETGFVITGHSLSFTGICPNCLKKAGGTEIDEADRSDDKDDQNDKPKKSDE